MTPDLASHVPRPDHVGATNGLSPLLDLAAVCRELLGQHHPRHEGVEVFFALILSGRKARERETSQGGEGNWGNHSLSQLSGKPLSWSCDTLRVTLGFPTHQENIFFFGGGGFFSYSLRPLGFLETLCLKAARVKTEKQ